MTPTALLIANRGEIAVRIARAAADLGIRSVAVHARDDAHGLHLRLADAAVALPGEGVAAYLDADALLAAARAAGCDAVHPGYGFLSENAAFAARVREAGLAFVGPRPELLALFGDKVRARALAGDCDVPVLAGTGTPTSLDEARAFVAGLPAGAGAIVKALAGGGGRGMRVVRDAAELEAAWPRCESEARKAFGDGSLYVERLMPDARHVEVQVIGDGRDAVHLGERECTLQRRHQKLVEVAPSPGLDAATRERLFAAALRMARAVRYEGLGTFEFLVSRAPSGATEFAFIETNPRLQVEHTVTEAVTGLDLVSLQLRLAGGATLDELGLGRGGPAPAGHAIQLRVNAETIGADGLARPSSGTLLAFEPPAGPGVRVDTFGHAGCPIGARYDSLLAKLIVHAPGGFDDAMRRARRALREFRIEGVATNVGLLGRLLAHPDVLADRIHTRFLDERIAELVVPGDDAPPAASVGAPGHAAGPRSARGADVLAVFAAGGETGAPRAAAPVAPPAHPDAAPVAAPLQGTVVSLEVRPGDAVRRDQPVAVLDAMKMEHVVGAPCAGIVVRVDAAPGDAVYEAAALAWIEPAADDAAAVARTDAVDLDHVRDDLREVLERRAALLDARRPEAVARRRAVGRRTVRENLDDLFDADSFVEYGGLALAAQRSRRGFEELLRMSPADGMIAGHGTVDAATHGEDAARCAVLAYDYTVFAGTQGVINHRKKDRMLALCERWAMPLVVFAEGGGGRPGDDWPTPAGLDTTTFVRMGALSGLVPTVGVVSGYCFAGNAALLGGCDVIVAARDANIGMGGPAMIEGGGLGVFRPEEIGPMSVQVPNGVVDVEVDDEAAAVAVARRYLSYFRGPLPEWREADPRRLRHAVPENRLRAYDVRRVIEGIADAGSVLELRRGFGAGMVTALIRLRGRPLGLIANDSRHLGGAIDADAADKAARFIQLCDAFDLPILSLSDTPGMMVGPEVEKTAQVRHVSRMFVAAANATVPFLTVVLRKGYGLGALAMTGGSNHASLLIVAWPTAEFGAMGLEGAIKLAYRKELAAIEDPEARKRWFEEKVAQSYERNKALATATFFEIDDVIDPADTRDVLARALRAAGPPGAARRKKRPSVDVW
ncbi:MAG TPA: carboxyl transferase domain-containing protein [Burkholderiaceae bacterium]|nr:carboxyl transferase domain-containing protein [Burkholderiaceae bacterium]